MKKTSLFTFATIAGLVLGSSMAFANEGVKDIVRDARGSAVMDERANCVHTKWTAEGNVCSDAPAPEPRLEVKREARTIYFDFNRSNVKNSEREKLDTLIGVIKDSQQVESVDILGFADEIGSASYNKKLSLKRAYAVQRYLAAYGGISTRSVDLAGLGESRPVTSCSTDMPRAERIACLAADRRVEIILNYAE